MALTRKVKSGLTQAPFATYIGEPGQIFFSNDTGEIRISDGVTPNGKPVYVAVTSANIGNLVITGASITTLNPNEDLDLVASGTGNVNVYGSFHVHTDGLGSTIAFGIDPLGFTTINVPALTTGDNGLLVNGSTSGVTTMPQVAGTTMRLVGNDGVTNTVAIDAFGTGAFPALINRHGRGTGATPTATKTGDTIGRWGAVGYGDTNFVIDQGIGRAASDIRFVATEDFTDARGGTQIQFYTSPNGGTQRTLSVTMDYTGITTGNLHSTNVFVSGNTISTGTTQAIGNFTANGTSTLIGDIALVGNTVTTGTTTLNGDVHITGNVDTTGASLQTGTMVVNGTISLNNQLSVSATGNIKFNDGTVQSTAAIQVIDNSNHVSGAFNTIGAVRHLVLQTDGTPNNTPSTLVARDTAGNIAVGNVTASTLNTTSVTANSSIAGSLTVYGNLNVVGTTVTTNAIVTTVDTKTFTIAGNAVSTIAADGAAFLVANIAGASVADWTYDDAQVAWRSNVSVVPATSLNGQSLGSTTREWNHLYAGEAYLSQKLNVGVVPLVEYLNVAQFTANVPQYSQVYNQNLSSNAGATTDFVAANDIGGDSNNYIDIGINSSNYSESAYSIQYANDGYVFINGGNLTVGTQSTGTDIVFHTDGTTADKEAGRVHLGRWILGGTDNGVDKLQVAGNVTVGNISATNLTNQFATLTANAATQANQITGANAAIVTANTAMKSYVDAVTTAWTANAAAQAGQITGANAAIAAVTTAWTANAATQQVSINSLATNANANTAAYLSNGISTNIVTTGNVTATTFTGNAVGRITNPVRDAGAQAGGTLTLDFTTDSIVRATYDATTFTVAFANYIAGRRITLILTNVAGAGRTFTVGVPAGRTTVNDANPSVASNRLIVIDYYSVGTDSSNVYASVNYN